MQHRRTNFRSLVASTAVAATFAASASLVPTAAAQELTADGIIADLETLARDAEKNSQDVLRLDGDVVKQEEVVRKLQGDVETATRIAEASRGAMDQHRGDISDFARQRMRGDVVDPITAVIGSVDAQDALDRSSYVNRFAREKEGTLAEVAKRQREAADGFARAAAARAAARVQLGSLEHQRGELEKKSAELEKRTREVRDRVDSLSPEELAAWRAKDNPITEGLAALLGSSAAVDMAMTKVGSPYSWGAAGPDSFDCSGLMYWAYQQLGKEIPRTSQAQLAGGTPVDRADLRPGDLIGFYEGITHVGMYVGNGMIIHASTYGVPVQVVPIEQGGPYMGAVRY
ncbi:NlpC/P60 family protein [Corynebacterium hansenii]|uniref:NlpC/P60 family protein n=1 Tax=Corynebacterium hansenii TaxID=394964 RepID=A0ABV7ZNN0_9CORY|nr:NlpC/P60 family protein [Corynebacterium hansenii]